MATDSHDVIFKPTHLHSGSSSTGDVGLGLEHIRITIRNADMSVTSIHIEDEALANYLATDANPSTPYDPQYPGSPATKKYVDDSISTAVASAYKYKGSVATYSSLPSSGNTEGDVWNVTDTDMNYAWTGSAWDQLGSTVDLSNYLAKDNTTAFTPTGDYNPATKKYVDDSVSANNWIEVNVATANGTAAKVGTTTAGNYTPTKGDFLLVNFVNGCNVASPTLNIDGSGAKAIRTGNANADKSTFALGSTANSNIKALLYYDGTYYRCWSTTNANTTYSAMSVSEGQTGTATAQRSMRADYLKEIIKYHAVDNSRLSDDWYSGTAIAPSQASIYYEFAKRDIQAGTDLEIVGISSHNLPAGYTELSFLGGSGSGYINTGNILQCKDTFKIKFKRPTATAPSGTLSFFGSLQGSNSIPRSNVGFRTNGYLFGGVNQTIDFASIDTNIHTIEIGYDGVSYYYKYDNGAKKTYTLTSTANPSINAYLFARNSSPIVYSGGIRIYYLEWHRENGTEVAHLIPAQRNSDGVLGMYDLVSDTFLAPAGSGTWSGEPESLGNVINFTNDSGFLTSSTGVTSVNGNHGAVTVNEPIVSATAPSNPTEGQIWYDTTNDQLKVYDGTNWNEVGKEYNAGDGIQINNNEISLKAEFIEKGDYYNISSPETGKYYLAYEEYPTMSISMNPGAVTIAYGTSVDITANVTNSGGDTLYYTMEAEETGDLWTGSIQSGGTQAFDTSYTPTDSDIGTTKVITFVIVDDNNPLNKATGTCRITVTASGPTPTP